MIIDYDSNNYAVLIDKKKLESVGFRKGDNFYIVNLDRGVVALIKKSDFKNVLKQKVRESLGSDYDTMRDFGLSNEQIKVIDKIIGIRFEERTKNNISTSLSEEENAILEDLINNNTIKLYNQGKYSETPVYSVTPDLFKYVKSSLNSNVNTTTAKKNSENVKPIQNKNTSSYSPPVQIKSEDFTALLNKFNKDGFVIAQNDNEAKLLSENLAPKIKSGQVIGIKGFDTRYYIFNTSLMNSGTTKICDCFSNSGGKCSLKEISEKTKLDENVCKGILMFLLEKGDIIEKSNSTYQML